MFQRSSLGRMTVWPRLLTGKSSVTPCSNANTRAWKTDIDSYDAGMTSRPVVVLAGGVGAAGVLGDRDLATHLYRTGRLTSGAPLHTVTAELAERLGVRSRILPMCDEPVETRLKTDAGDLHFQEYFVRERCRPQVREIYWTGMNA